MENELILVDKLKVLAELSKEASNEFEKAAVYAAVSAIKAEFYSCDEKLDGNFLEALVHVCCHISSAVGYDESNMGNIQFEVDGALGKIASLRDSLSRV
ncbi:hypothetical protein AYI84_19435 [Shewanella algae]|uniref:hypothetical protein n=1 Tax=Shewanella algae TaxID=38313 RepID=UPI0011829B64|nr:hypothetical protein [Shewanella algae]TVK98907.1 hypothetical protein AYI84_19435 [Shewanella algae]